MTHNYWVRRGQQNASNTSSNLTLLCSWLWYIDTVAGSVYFVIKTAVVFAQLVMSTVRDAINPTDWKRLDSWIHSTRFCAIALVDNKTLIFIQTVTDRSQFNFGTFLPASTRVASASVLMIYSYGLLSSQLVQVFGFSSTYVTNSVGQPTPSMVSPHQLLNS